MPDDYETPIPSQRSIMDRMLKPMEKDRDKAVRQRLAMLSFQEIDRIVDHFGQILNHLAAQRKDLKVVKDRDATGWHLHLKISGSAPDPLVPNEIEPEPEPPPNPLFNPTRVEKGAPYNPIKLEVASQCVKCGNRHEHIVGLAVIGCACCEGTCRGVATPTGEADAAREQEMEELRAEVEAMKRRFEVETMRKRVNGDPTDDPSWPPIDDSL